MYLREIGGDLKHPFTSVNCGSAHITESWWCTAPWGFHVNTFTPKVDQLRVLRRVPEEVGDATLEVRMAQIGEPRYAVPAPIRPTRCSPSPAPVLFPSYMWHARTPFMARPAHTIAFDALPTD